MDLFTYHHPHILPSHSPHAPTVRPLVSPPASLPLALRALVQRGEASKVTELLAGGLRKNGVAVGAREVGEAMRAMNRRGTVDYYHV